MPRLTIDDREVEVAEGATVLDAARKLGLDIPALCHLDGHPPNTSCFACVVKVQGREALVPSCATRAEDGMRVESETEEVRTARTTALELLLGDHVGDCAAPCQGTCPAHMDIPQMVRQLVAGDLLGAIRTVKAHIALPAVLGRICPAPCERGCRRALEDAGLSIMLLKRRAADADLESAVPYLPPCRPASGKHVAIVGAGPTGLAAAYYLLQCGHACTIYDDHDEPGGGLRYEVPADRLPREVLDAEIAVVRRLGARFRMGVRAGRDITLADIQKDSDAVVLALGELKIDGAAWVGIPVTEAGLPADRHTFETSVVGVFAGGDAVRRTRLAVRSVADGRTIAESVDQYVSGRQVVGPHTMLSVHIGSIAEAELQQFLAGASAEARLAPAGGAGAGLTQDEARAEADRCLHCDCRKPLTCKLRLYGDKYGAKIGHYKGKRKPFVQLLDHPEIVYEPGKCIACGICLRIAEEAREPLGLAFIGRGFQVRVGVPLGHSLADGLRTCAKACAEACPTGAIAVK